MNYCGAPSHVSCLTSHYICPMGYENIREQLEELSARFFATRGWTAHPFQMQCLEKYFRGYHGLLNAPTGSGKTYALALPPLLHYMLHPPAKKGPFLIWITPLKSLSVDIRNAIQYASDAMGAGWEVALRNGDTPSTERARQKKNPPQCLVITPESLHILLAQKDYPEYFQNLHCIVADEWHELMGNKRGVQVELAISRLRHICPKLRIWGISATIGNLDEARDVLVPVQAKVCTVRSHYKKIIRMETLLPDDPGELPWGGHLGIKLLPKVLPIIQQSKTTLIFTNTRSQSEIWYKNLLEVYPDLAGRIAIHHGSLSSEVREWVEKNLHAGLLKAVVCTSSLELGVDFRPVDTVIQIGSPKGVARFVQRAGRSGHSHGEESRIYMLPTHSMELIEAAALRTAVEKNYVESRQPVVRAFDVLIQYALTLAVSEGFKAWELYEEVIQTNCFRDMRREEWQWILNFIEKGGNSLEAYDEYKKVIVEDGIYKIANRRMAMQQRLSIGTIANDQSIFITFAGGKRLGNIEEYFISRLNPGDTFVFSGKILDLVRVEGNTAIVRLSAKKKGIVPSWQGGRMSLSSELAQILREKIDNYKKLKDPELLKLKDLFAIQEERSMVPHKDELLMEYFHSSEGHHLFVFPFEGRMINEGMAMLMAYRFNRIRPTSFSIAMNDYGFELLSDQPIPVEMGLEEDIFSTKDLIAELYQSTNYSEMTRRRFSQIATISGLIFKGFAEKRMKSKHLQANSSLFFKVFKEYDPDNLLLKQAEEEVFYYQLEEHRLRAALNRIQAKKIVLKRTEFPSPFAFPIMVDRFREQLTTEKLEDRIERLLKEQIHYL